MSLIALILFIILGVILLWVEFLVVPGITIAGIGGFLLIGLSIYISYDTYGLTTGNYVLLGSVLFMAGSVYFSLKSNTWRRTMLESNIDGKVNVVKENSVHSGETGVTVTRLAPIGKVEVGGEFYEGKSDDNIIDAGTAIVVVKVLNDKLIVKPLK